MVVPGKITADQLGRGTYMTESSKRILSSGEGVVVKCVIELNERVTLQMMNISDTT